MWLKDPIEYWLKYINLIYQLDLVKKGNQYPIYPMKSSKLNTLSTCNIIEGIFWSRYQDIRYTTSIKGAYLVTELLSPAIPVLEHNKIGGRIEVSAFSDGFFSNVLARFLGSSLLELYNLNKWFAGILIFYCNSNWFRWFPTFYIYQWS